MTSVDDLFKSSPTGSKRKFDSFQSAEQAYKSTTLDVNGKASNNDRGATVEDGGDDDAEAGPEMPPDMEEPEADDEEGRFFGGGITNGTAEILDYMDERDDEQAAPEKIDSAWLRKTALNFEKRISKNAELRAKFEDDPPKFMTSEADLDADIKALSILSEHPALYSDFAQLGCTNSLVSLLAHENADIAIDAIEIIGELTADDVEAEPEQWNALVDAMLEGDLLDLLTQNFERFDESNESDRSGVYHSLEVLENLVSRPALLEKISSPSLLQWLSKRIQAKESPVGQNKQYAAEVLAILLQGSPSVQKSLIETGGIDILLQLLSAYRQRDPPKGTEEEEYVENLFDCLTCLVDVPEGKVKFLESEGIELALIMLREGKMSKVRALRLLDHALAGQQSRAVCDHLVECAGLKTLFGAFVKKQDNQTVEHLLGVFASLLRYTAANSSARIRTLAKFVEKQYQKIEKVVTLRREFYSKHQNIEREIGEEKKDLSEQEQQEMADEWFSRRLDAGLYCLQTIDLILAWLIAEDDGAKNKIRELMADKDESLDLIRATLKEQIDEMNGGSEEGIDTKSMLSTLVDFI